MGAPSLSCFGWGWSGKASIGKGHLSLSPFSIWKYRTWVPPSACTCSSLGAVFRVSGQMICLSSHWLDVPLVSCQPCGHATSFLSAECLRAGHLQMLCDTFGIKSLLINFSGQRFLLGGLTFHLDHGLGFCSLGVLPPGLSPLLLPSLIGESCIWLFSVGITTSQLPCAVGGLLHDIP